MSVDPADNCVDPSGTSESPSVYNKTLCVVMRKHENSRLLQSGDEKDGRYRWLETKMESDVARN